MLRAEMLWAFFCRNPKGFENAASSGIMGYGSNIYFSEYICYNANIAICFMKSAGSGQ